MSDNMTHSTVIMKEQRLCNMSSCTEYCTEPFILYPLFDCKTVSTSFLYGNLP